MCLHCCYVDEACYLNTHLSVVVAKLRARCTVPCILTLRAQSYGFKWPSGDKTAADISAISCRSRTTAKGLLWGQGTLGTLWAWWVYCIWLLRRYLADEELRRDVTDSVAWKGEKELLLFLPHEACLPSNQFCPISTSLILKSLPTAWQGHSLFLRAWGSTWTTNSILAQDGAMSLTVFQQGLLFHKCV